ncbi:thioredoxin family protein [Nannocystis bainbridge]|uniref:Thioredoxin n=1 Tax=Nannocystis bainbridge TaxID=2995303 RepID=A0ABT5E169_9BACT|nr:thioredoxin domain-containing protein [Nannocystis bainbridge]MDC0719173.1 thioredoxin domain-containing protein [Nannocystis bainbridge]
MSSSNVLTFTEQNFEQEVVQASWFVPVLVVFTATWAGRCSELLPIVEKIADDYQGKVKVGILDIDGAPETTQKNGVKSVPTSIAFRGGSKVSIEPGLTSREVLLSMLSLA